MVGPGDGKSVSHGDRVSVWEDEKVLETDGGDSCTILNVPKTTELSTFKE